MGRAHLAQCHQERKCRLRALVLIGAVDVEPVATTVGRGIIEPLPEGVLAEEPVEGPSAVLRPTGVPADLIAVRQADVTVQASTGCWSNVAAASPREREPVASDRCEIPLLRQLQRQQPVERAQARINDVSPMHTGSGDDERL